MNKGQLATLGRSRRVSLTKRGKAYEAANTQRLTSKYWADARTTDADSALLPELQTIRNRARYEIRNSGYARHIVNTYANDVIGPSGPTLKLSSDSENSEDALKAAARAWGDWSADCDLRGRQHLVDILRSGLKGCWSDGEFFLQIVDDPDGQSQEIVDEDGRRAGTVRFKILPIAVDRVQTPVGMEGRRDIKGGIRFDVKTGRPLEYFVMADHPGNSLTGGFTTEGDWIPAHDMIHYYACDDPDQSRGEPWFASVLENFQHGRHFFKSTIIGARTAAVMGAALLKTPAAEIPPDNESDALDIMDIEPGTMAQLPEGYEPFQLKPEHPAVTFNDFVKAIFSEIGLPKAMPWIRISCSAAGTNFSQSRLDLNCYWSGIRTEEALLVRIVLMRLWREFMVEYSLQVPVAIDMRPIWRWDPVPSVDPMKETKAESEQLDNGTTSPQRIILGRGEDPDEVLAEQAQWKAKQEAAGLSDKKMKGGRREKLFEDIARAVRSGIPIGVSEARISLGLPAEPPEGSLARFNDQDVLQYHVENPVLTINEIRKRLDLPHVTWGDVTPAEFLKELRPDEAESGNAVGSDSESEDSEQLAETEAVNA